MFKEAAAEWATDEVRKLKRDRLQGSSCVLNVPSCAVIMNESLHFNVCTVCMPQDFKGERAWGFRDGVFIKLTGMLFIYSI